MKWLSLCAVLACAAAVSGCDRGPSSVPTPRATPGTMPAPDTAAPGTPSTGPGSAPGAPESKP
ncbi:hypothetical protein [Comamonas odontotermitis]|uniref:hypothetical protein n=1 Tax=Comamonas odontotermitis TaxID=379895 RepID=UPI003752B4DC